jgi:hypothetical protein
METFGNIQLTAGEKYAYTYKANKNFVQKSVNK